MVNLTTQYCRDYMQAPRDKLVCILNCCRVINNLLHVQVQHGEARGELSALFMQKLLAAQCFFIFSMNLAVHLAR